MTAGELPGVDALASPADLPVPAPPGVHLVTAADPWSAAGAVARSLGARRLFTTAEATAELDRRRRASVAGPGRALAAAAERARAAAGRAAAARAALPPGLAAVAPGELRRAAEALDPATASVRAARAALGPRPHLDAEAAYEAREAQVLADLARVERAALAPRANAVLTAANLGAGAIVAGRLASPSLDPVFGLVAALPLGALGIVASMAAGNVRRSRAAARRRWAALRSLGLCTLAALDAREAAARDWDARAAGVAHRRRELVRARAAWEALAGPGAPPGRAGELVGALEEVAALDAEAAAAHRRWAGAAEGVQAAEDAGGGGAPLVVVDVGTPPGRRAAALRALAERAGRSTVVVVAASGAASPPPATTGADPVEGRAPVLARLLRLRARQGGRRPGQPPGSAAAG
ncbi:MAG: hypothetical protein ACLGIO_12535 [Acidimicrobiia bacterium]